MTEIKIQQTGTTLKVTAVGDWEVRSLARVHKDLQGIDLASYKQVCLETQPINVVDTAGAWILYRFIQRCRQHKLQVETPQLLDVLAELFPKFPKNIASLPTPADKSHFIMRILTKVGYKTSKRWERSLSLLSFLGETTVRMVRGFSQGSFRLKETLAYIDYTGVRALPIVGTISFLIGIVLIYQAVFQFRRFGAEIFAIDMLAISMAREIGILLTAIVVAGRSGSAFAAQIGTMKLNQEVDALRILGMSPFDVLIVPRVVGLIITLPLLAFYSLVMGLVGGAVMSIFNLNMTIGEYITHLHQALTLQSFSVGLVKAPFFAFIIALVGCFEGMSVRGGAASVGLHTTRSVVVSIFLVIIFNALFSVVFTYIGV